MPGVVTSSYCTSTRPVAAGGSVELFPEVYGDYELTWDRPGYRANPGDASVTVYFIDGAPAAERDVASPSLSSEPAPAPASPARIGWAVLLARIYDVLPLLCPARGGELRILAFLTDPPIVAAILLHLDLPHKPPPLSLARGPPQSDLLTGLLDQTPAFDPAAPDPVPDFEFDQSLPDDFDP